MASSQAEGLLNLSPRLQHAEHSLTTKLTQTRWTETLPHTHSPRTLPSFAANSETTAPGAQLRSRGNGSVKSSATRQRWSPPPVLGVTAVRLLDTHN